MINYKEKIAQILDEAIEGLTAEELQNMVEVPADNKMGDYAFPCFKLAKVLRKAPPMIAKDIAEKISSNPIFAKVEQVNAYVNMFLSRELYVKDTVGEVLEKGDAYGSSKMGEGKKVIVEYSSPNIAKPCLLYTSRCV